MRSFGMLKSHFAEIFKAFSILKTAQKFWRSIKGKKKTWTTNDERNLHKISNPWFTAGGHSLEDAFTDSELDKPEAKKKEPGGLDANGMKSDQRKADTKNGLTLAIISISGLTLLK